MKNSTDRRFVVLLVAQLVTSAVVLFVLFKKPLNYEERAENLRMTATKLLAAGIKDEAIHLYEKFLDEESVPNPVRANVAYSIGELYESEGRPEKALSWYYRVEAWDSRQLKDSQKKIVSILESLGRHQAAKAVLSNATSLNAPQVTGVVVAEVSGKKILMEDLDSAMDALPQSMKQVFEGVEGKKRFLKKYVADELLLEKAKRLGHDSDPKLLRSLEEAKRQTLIARVIDEEIFAKIAVDENDLKNFYEAHKAKYTEHKKLVPFEKAKQAVISDYRLEKGQKKYQDLIESLAQSDQVKLNLENLK